MDVRGIIEKEKAIDRWEEGIDHHPKSIEIIDFITEIDFHVHDDYFCWKSGGDGDNGETLMFQLDAYFENKNEKLESQLADERIISSKLVLKLEEALEVAMIVVDFYANPYTSWEGEKRIIPQDVDWVENEYTNFRSGGSLAREAKTKIEEILK